MIGPPTLKSGQVIGKILTWYFDVFHVITLGTGSFNISIH